MPKGFAGKVLRVDLTENRTWIEEPPESWYRTYFGGSAVVAYYLLKEVPADLDAFDPENRLIFATGPFTGTPLAGSGRNSVGAKSPLNGGFGDSQGGGYWMAELKRAGFDHVVIAGRAESPVYLWIKDGKAEIRDASHIWGKETLDVEEAIREELGDDRIRVTQCGVAGENLVRFACIVNDLTHFSGRTGMGAVMGSKNLRAVAVRGSEAVDLDDRDTVIDLARSMAMGVKEGTRGRATSLKEHGTAGGLMALNEGGGLPTRNFQFGDFEGAEKISGQTMTDTILVDRETCHACPIFCKRVVQSDEHGGVDPVYGGPEYETLGSLGSNCGIDDLAAVAKGGEICNKLGLDTISTGMTISFAMECFERGVLSPEDLDGLELRFGNGEAMVKMVEKIARREGVGDLFAEGAARAARSIGPQAHEMALTIKGQEIPMHEPRFKHGLGLGYSVSPTGADHCHNIHDTAYENSADDVSVFGILEPLPIDDLTGRKVRLFYYESNWKHMLNSSVCCQFIPWTKREYVDAIRAITGWDTSVYELVKAGERAATLARIFNMNCGFDDRDDELNDRFFTAFERGPLEGKEIDQKVYNRARVTYYHLMGWDDLGRPTPSRLSELGVDWVIDRL